MLRSEDWLAVAVGLGLVAAVLLGLRPDLPAFDWKVSADLGSVLGGENLAKSLKVGALIFAVSAPGVALMGGRVGHYAAGFPAVFAIAWLSQAIAGNAAVRWWGLEYVIFALGMGLLVSNTIGVPAWLGEAARTEYFIKTGLVILGSGILFGEVLQAGALGVVQAVLVVIVVWTFAFWLARRLGVDLELSAMLSTAVSICGVSAAIAACGAIQGDKKKLSYVTSLVLIVAVPMMVVMPWIIQAAGIPDAVGGAWLGGTLDTSGSVVAAGELVGPRAMKAGVIVKFSQNVLIGVAAFALAVWWAYVRRDEKSPRPSAAVIWERFPKFVLGFLVASIVFSALGGLRPELVAATKKTLSGLRTAWFALAFASIGLETRFKELVQMGGGRPALAFVGAQAFNVLWTLGLAYLLFGGALTPVPAFE